MWHLPCQQPDNFLRWTRQSLWKMCTNINEVQNIQPCVLKTGESINDQNNDNVPNSKRNSLYNGVKTAWMLNYGTTKFLPQHMNSVLVEAWYAFKVPAGNIIRGRFAKTKLTPLSPPDSTKNTQEVVSVPSLLHGWKISAYR